MSDSSITSASGIIQNIKNYIESTIGNNLITVNARHELSNTDPVEYCTDVTISFSLLEKVEE